MFKFIDNILDRLTMYRVVLYYLIFLMAIALVFSLFGWLGFSPQALVFSSAIILFFSWLSNILSAKLFNVPANAESVHITALILMLIITPPLTGTFFSSLPFLIGASVIAQVSKYSINIFNKHIFNPAALAVVLTGFAIGRSASWWVGTTVMFWPVLIGGLLVIRKVRRFSLVIAFILAAVTAALALSASSTFTILKTMLFASPLVFFASIMLTEPLTLPPTRDKQIAYGILVGWLFSPFTHFGSLYPTPELALVIGNVFSYITSPKFRPRLNLTKKIKAAEGVGDFEFSLKEPLKFLPGQYMEFTLGHKSPDSRGNRRYLTIASSPTEKNLLLGVKFYQNPSTFKQALLSLEPGEEIVAGQLAGDFVLPKNPLEKLVFVAGGIGITPFRSMMKFLIDKNQKRDIIQLYANRNAEEIAYADVFEEALKKLNIPTYYVLSRPAESWQGISGHLDENIIIQTVPDFLQRTFYISGSHNMVEGVKKALLNLGVSRLKIKTDFFPGLA